MSFVSERRGLTGRRDLLRGLGAGAFFLAPMARRAKAWAAGKAGHGNFLFFFTPNGFARNKFGSDGNDASFTLRAGMAGAEPMKDHITVVRGLSQKAQGGGRPFHFQITRLLTCAGGGKDDLQGYGPSIDHVIAQKVTGTRPITLSVHSVPGSTAFNRLSWRDARVVDPFMNDPRDAYKVVFGQFTPSQSPDELGAALEREQSLLDFLKSDIDRFKTRLGASERVRVEAHLDAVRGLEQKIAKGSAVCDLGKTEKAKTTAAPSIAQDGPAAVARLSAHADLQIDIITTAFACGIRNAATLMWQRGGGGLDVITGRGMHDEHHHVSHSVRPRSRWYEIDSWYAGRFADVLDRLKKLEILDNTVVVWGSEIAELHSHNNCTFVVGGGRALGIRHRKTLEFPFHGNEMGFIGPSLDPKNAGISDLWVSVQKACGVQSDTFGEHSTGGLPGLRA